MQTVEIEFGELPISTYSTFEEAIEAAEAQPGQESAKQDSLDFIGTTLEGGRFGESTCLLQFSNGRNLLVEALDFRVHWKILAGESPKIESVPRRQLRHSKSEQSWEFDPNEMISTISGSQFVMLRVCEHALLVYTRGNEIFWLSAYRDRTTGRDLLHACWET